MIELTHLVDSATSSNRTSNGQLTLPIEQRVRSRLRAKLDDGRDVGLFLPRGIFLRGGDLLSNEEGLLVEVIAADETVSTIQCNNPTLLARAAYHLGNRHIPLQVEKDWLRYQHDHVLDDMLRQMGLELIIEQAPFEPEAGAYQQAADGHNHSHGHSHSHSHNHE